MDRNMTWCRLWHDMPTDPKFRVVAKRSGRPTSEVLAVFTTMLANASANEEERGTLRGWCDEDVAITLDMETEHVEAIYSAMQGKLLDGDRLTGWERRQPKRERGDNSAPRVKAYRERKKNVTPCNVTDESVTPRNAIDESVTPCNALEERREEKRREESSVVARERAQETATPPSDFISLMVKAAEPCLDNPVNCQGLLTEATPMMWLENGCDLERDILPTLRAAAITRKGKRISSWSYFTAMIAEAKTKRLAGLPSITLPNQKSKTYTPTPRRDRELSDADRERIALEVELMN